MLELTFGEQVKIILSRKGMTIKELAEKIEKQTGKKMSRQNLTQRLGRDNFQEQDMRMIAKILECPFYLDILEEHEDRTEKPVKEQKAAEPEQKAAPARAEERDITIGELVDIHKELDAIEKKKSKKKAKKVVEENPEYVQETIFDFFVNEPAAEPEELVTEEPEAAAEPEAEVEPEAAAEPQEAVEETAVEESAYEPEPEDGQVEEPAVEIEEEPLYEETEPAYEEAEPEYAEEPAYEEAEPEYAEEPAYEEAEPEYAEEPAYEEAEPEYVEEPVYEETEPEYEEESVTEPEVAEPEPKKTEPEKKAHGWRAFFGIHKKHEEPVKEEKEEEKPEIQYHEFDYSENGESGELAEEFLPDEPEEAETYAAETETAAYENAEQLNTNYDAGYQNRYAQENEEDLFTSTEEDLEKGELNPYTGHEYESNSVRMHPNRIGYVQVYDRGTHQWTDMTEWAFLGYQERKKALLGKDYEPPIYLD
ncbi:helix-turn-helix domain-containing protein [Dorea sp.]